MIEPNRKSLRAVIFHFYSGAEERLRITYAPLKRYWNMQTRQPKEAWPGRLFEQQETKRRSDAMRKAIHEVQEARKTLGQDDIWSHDVKASDDVLNPIFRRYFEMLDMPNLMAKKQYYELALHVPEELIDSEVREKLDRIVEVWQSATPSEL